MARTTTLATILELMGESTDDDLTVATTTNIAGSSTVILSTALNSYDRGADDYFNGWWCYIDGTANPAVYREVSDYATTGGSLTLRGANLTVETATKNITLYKYDRTQKINAINRAKNKLFPSTRIDIDNMDLVTGNILPPFLWSTTALLDLYDEPSGTLLKNTTAAYIWNGSTNAKITGSGANDVLVLDSDVYPRLLNLQGDSVDFKCWIYPDTADDSFLTIYTLQPDTTAQTLNSTTTTYATTKNLIMLEDQTLNDDLTKIEFRLRIATTAKVTYFDMPRVTGHDVYDYLLPSDFQDGDLSSVSIQTSGEADDPCDDINPDTWQTIHDWKIIDDGTYRFLHFDSLYPTERRIRLIGSKPLETLALDASTVTLSEPQLTKLVAKSNEELFKSLASSVSSEDKGRLEFEQLKWAAEVERLHHLDRARPSMPMKLPRL